ncbi:MAG TPA: tRNA pseudouridine(38-40) synthase TruA [Thermoanaerobaculia bacterium]|jgi:tRNA pseudouridine38-40 synthase|nr:tRNA pseudouridine(38-40) synthase TruA [Thermoanaerobaculia bacterium]
MRVLFTLQYLGTRYGGWQTQANAVSVQQVVEEALAKIFAQDVRVHGAGRTDAGVHAEAQRAHFDAPFDIPPRGLVLGINQLLPSDIRVTHAKTVADDFHARFSAKTKTYEYRIWNAEVADVFTAETYAHVAKALDDRAMHDAAQELAGTHDFAVFTVADPEVSSTTRSIESIAVQRDGEAIRITVTADGFLRYMVRRIAGSLIEIGRGKLARDGMWHEARWTAPAKGLVLKNVSYE